MKLMSILLISLLGVCGGVGLAEAAPSAVLSWSANPEADLAGYKVYRGTGACGFGPLQPLLTAAGVPVSVGKVTTYTDANIPPFDGDLCYEITAFDTAGNESLVRSNRPIKVVNLVPPQAPRLLIFDLVP